MSWTNLLIHIRTQIRTSLSMHMRLSKMKMTSNDYEINTATYFSSSVKGARLEGYAIYMNA